MILAFTVLFALAPHTIIDIPIRIFHFPLAMLHIIPPFSLINVPICVTIPSVTLLAVLHNSLVTFPIAKEIIAVNQGVIFPVAEVYISVVVDVNTQVITLSVGIQLTIIDTTVKVLFFHQIGQILQS